MKLRTLATGSSGNCYLLESENEILILEAGIPFIQILRAIDFKRKNVVGCVISHSHGDHAKHLQDYRMNAVPCFTPYTTDKPKPRTYGGFKIQPLKLEHNVVTYGFLINHTELGKFLYITDTSYCKYKFKGLNSILIECNHNLNLLDENASNYEHSVADHMSLQTCKDFIKVNNNVFLDNVILCHMSDKNINEEIALAEIETVTNANVWSAHTHDVVDVSLVPF